MAAGDARHRPVDADKRSRARSQVRRRTPNNTVSRISPIANPQSLQGQRDCVGRRASRCLLPHCQAGAAEQQLACLSANVGATRKDVENRDWKPARPLVLLIHAGLKTDFAASGFMQQLGVEPPITSVLAYGAIIGAVTVTGWTETSPSRWASRTRWHWLLSNPVAAQQPIPYRGQTGLFRPPEDWRDRFQAA